MFKKTSLFLIASLLNLSFENQNAGIPASSGRGICIDLNHTVFQPTWIRLAEQCGLNIDYMRLDRVLDVDLKQGFLEADSNLEIAFINLSDEFLFSCQNTESRTIDKVMKVFKAIKTASPKKICLIMPQAFSRCWQANKQIILNLCLNLFDPEKQDLGLFEKLSTSISARAPYATALLPEPEMVVSAEQSPKQSIELYIQSLYCASGPVLLLSSSFLNAIAPTEDFRTFPTSRELQQTFFKMVVNFFQSISPVPQKGSQISYQSFFQSIALTQQQPQAQQKPNKDCSIVGWMEIEDFCANPQDSKEELERKAQAQTKLVWSIITSRLTGLWININPNVLFGVNGIKKDRKSICMEALALLAKSLKAACDSASHPMPKFFLGVEIGNNLVDQNLPATPEQDLWGKVYSDLPCALDKQFWTMELIDPCKEFISDWNARDGAQAMPVFSIVVDLEFYNRKSLGTFSSCMGFGRRNLEQCKINSNTLGQGSNTFTTAFQQLSENAVQLGQMLAKSCKEINVPNLYFYMPTLDLNWFYASLLKGASANVDQCHVFSFSNRADLYKPILQKLEVRATCSPVFMLSKLKDCDKSVKSMQEIASGASDANFPMVWLNRFSRIVNKYQPEQWHKIEQSPAQQSIRDRFLKIIAQRQNLPQQAIA